MRAILSSGVSRGLSKLLSMLIGLVVVIVAGIAMANTFYQYAYPVSIRPAVIIEYADLVKGGDHDILVLNLKNAGNVPVDTRSIIIQGLEGASCNVAGSGAPGSAFSITCRGDLVSEYDGSVLGILRVGFEDGSSMVMVFKAGKGQAMIIGTAGTGTETSFERYVEIKVVEKTVTGRSGEVRSVTIYVIGKNGYDGEVTLRYSESRGNVIKVSPGRGMGFNPGSVVLSAKQTVATVTFRFEIQRGGEVTISGSATPHARVVSDSFTVVLLSQ